MPLLDNPRHYRIRRLCLDALMLCLALALSYLEAMLPLHALLPLPGFRFGWAQLAITLVFFRIGKGDAAIVSALRVLIMGILFGSVTSVLFSAMGALLSYGGLWLGAIALKRKCSYIGLGVLCAALHNLGQLIAAALLFGSGVLLSYLPALMLASLIFGSAGGWILNATVRRLPMERRML